jgi:hypothetical protein
MQRATFVLAFAFLFSGCIQLDLLMKLKKDGSGTLVEKVLFDASLLEELLSQMPGEKMPKPWDVNEKELREQAAKKGQGVTFVSAKPVADGKWKGFEAIYAFTDVSKVSIEPNPGDRAPKAPGQPAEAGNPMKFTFTKGKTSKLSITLPQDEGKKAKEKPIDPSDPSFEMMRGMMKDMAVDIAIEVDGKITSTNASFREGSRVTLLALKLNDLIGDPEKVNAVLNAESFADAAKAFNSVKGMKIETKKKVDVAFE